MALAANGHSGSTMRDTSLTFILFGIPWAQERYTCSIPSERLAVVHTIECVWQVSIPLLLGKLENKYQCQEMEVRLMRQ
jgi:hypothetical protein